MSPNSSSLRVEGCTFHDNKARVTVATIESTGGTLTVVDSSFTRNFRNGMLRATALELQLEEPFTLNMEQLVAISQEVVQVVESVYFTFDVHGGALRVNDAALSVRQQLFV